MKCHWCKQEMADKTTRSCTGNTVVSFPDGESLPAIPSSGRCGDCNVANNGFHHPGCDQEKCPRCQGQLISCGCLDEDEED